MYLVLTMKSVKYADSVLDGPHDVSWPPKNVEKNKPYRFIKGALDGHYVLDYLVPMKLGGAPVAANVWPAATSGIGLNQKAQLDHVLYHRVCGRLMTLPQAQSALKTDWFAAWLKYVVD
jgi:hypothetical protein